MTESSPKPSEKAAFGGAREAIAERVAPRLSHDINNQIQGVLGFTELAVRDLPPGAPALDFLERVMQAGEEAARLLHALTEFRHMRSRQPVALDLNAIAEQALTLFGAAPSRGIEIDFDPAPNLPKIMGLPEQWIAAILAVLTAAEECACPSRFTLETRLGEKGEVIFEIRHDGQGPLEEPKAAPGADAYALWLAPAVARTAGGQWRVESSPAMGTRYGWTTPSAAPPPLSQAVGAPSRRAVVIERDADVAQLLRRILEQMKFEVENFIVTDEAARRFDGAATEPVGLVLLDWEMPGGTAAALFERLREANPAQRIVILTSYAWLHDELELAPDSPVHILVKPFSPRDLIAQIEAMF